MLAVGLDSIQFSPDLTRCVAKDWAFIPSFTRVLLQVLYSVLEYQYLFILPLSRRPLSRNISFGCVALAVTKGNQHIIQVHYSILYYHITLTDITVR